MPRAVPHDVIVEMIALRRAGYRLEDIRARTGYSVNCILRMISRQAPELVGQIKGYVHYKKREMQAADLGVKQSAPIRESYIRPLTAFEKMTGRRKREEPLALPEVEHSEPPRLFHAAERW